MRNNKKIFYGIIAVFLITGIIIGAFIIKNNSADKDKAPNSTVNTADVKESKYTPKKIDTSGINLSDEIVKVIKDNDKKNADRNVENYKRMIIELDVPEKYQEKVNDVLKKGYNPADVFTCYNFVYEKYGQAEEVLNLLKDKRSNSSWDSVFEKYNKIHKKFVPSDFKDGVIDEILKTDNLKLDDIMIADRISQKGFAKFEELIEQRKKNENWKDIKLSFGILNLEEHLYSTAVTSADIANYTSGKDKASEGVVLALSIARKANIDDESLIKELSALNKEETIYSKIYANKYNN